MNAMDALRKHQAELEKRLVRNRTDITTAQTDLEMFRDERADLERDLADVNVALQALNPDPDTPATGPDAPLRAVPGEGP